jgi:hypothetical protein
MGVFQARKQCNVIRAERTNMSSIRQNWKTEARKRDFVPAVQLQDVSNGDSSEAAW